MAAVLLGVKNVNIKYCRFSAEPHVFPDRCAAVMIYLLSVTKKNYRTANTMFLCLLSKMKYLEYYRNLCTTVHFILAVLYMS
jgi:hypothetical protein